MVSHIPKSPILVISGKYLYPGISQEQFPCAGTDPWQGLKRWVTDRGWGCAGRPAGLLPCPLVLTGWLGGKAGRP